MAKDEGLAALRRHLQAFEDDAARATESLLAQTAAMESARDALGDSIAAAVAPPAAAPVEAEGPRYHPPERMDDWAELLFAAIAEHEAEHGRHPSAAELWDRLRTAPPHGYTVAFDRPNRWLIYQTHPLTRDGLRKRLERYTVR
jgi:hypothetical protein